MTPTNQNVIYGMLPPQNIELEEVVLGSLMTERDAITKVELTPEVFYKESHRKIFEVIQKLDHKGQNIDLITVTIELKNSGILEEIGGPSEITRLTRRIASAAHIEQHVRILTQSYIRRELIRISTEIMTMSYDEQNDIVDIFQLYELAVSKIDQVIQGKKKGRELKEVLKNLTDEIEKRCILAAKGGLTGINTGFGKLNRLTSGWQPTWLIVFAARPAMGKTAISINGFAKAAAKEGKWVNIFSLEMEDLPLAERLILGASNIEPYKLKHGKMEDADWVKFNQARSELESLPIFIDDSPYVTISHMRNVARANKRKNKCDLIIIDYLQLAQASDTKVIREQQVSEMSRQLKAMAKSLNIPVILISQLSRDVEKRGGIKKPGMADLRESGAIEQDADLILFPWRPKYYGLDVDGVEDQDHYGELVFAKNRHGAIEDVQFWHNDSMSDFSDMPFNQTRYKEIIPYHEPTNININFDKQEDAPF